MPIARSLDWKWVLRTAIIVVGVLFAVASMVERIPESAEDLIDAELLWEHAKVVAAGDTLYSPWPDFGPHYMTEAAPYPVGRVPYPPFLTVALSPLVSIGDLGFYRGWFFLLAVSFAVYAAMLCKLATGTVHLRGTCAAVAALAIYPGTWGPFNTGDRKSVV